MSITEIIWQDPPQVPTNGGAPKGSRPSRCGPTWPLVETRSAIPARTGRPADAQTAGGIFTADGWASNDHA